MKHYTKIERKAAGSQLVSALGLKRFHGLFYRWLLNTEELKIAKVIMLIHFTHLIFFVFT